MPVKRHNKGIQTWSRFTVVFSKRRPRVFLKQQKNICSTVFTTAKYYANSKAFNKRFMGCHVQKMIKICIRPMKNGTGRRGMEKPATFRLYCKSGCCLWAELLTVPYLEKWAEVIPSQYLQSHLNLAQTYTSHQKLFRWSSTLSSKELFNRRLNYLDKIDFLKCQGFYYAKIIYTYTMGYLTRTWQILIFPRYWSLRYPKHKWDCLGGKMELM